MKSFTISCLLDTLLIVAFVQAQDFIKPESSAKRYRFLPPGLARHLDKVDSKLSLPSRLPQNVSGSKDLKAPAVTPDGHGLSSNTQDLWMRHYAAGLAPAYDVATAMTSDALGNVYVTGYSASRFFEYFTAKYDAAGVQVWSARYDAAENGDDRAFAIAVDAFGNVYVTGESYSTGSAYDYATIKYNSAGEQQWVARYNGPGNYDDHATAIAVDPSGNVYVTGWSSSGTSSDYATIKYDSAGAVQWVVRYNGPGNSEDKAIAIAVDASGNVYATGSSGAYPNSDYATIKYNFAGAEQWVDRYNGPGNSEDKATALAVDPAGNVYVTGGSYGSGTFYDYATVKYNSAGAEWVARYNGPGNYQDMAQALAVDDSGNVYVTGYSNGAGSDYATIKYNGAGSEQWIARGPGNSRDGATAIAVDPAGNVYMTGSGWNGTNDDYVTIKYNGAGASQWVAHFNGPENSDDKAAALAVDPAGNVYVTGSSGGSGTFSNNPTIKYSSTGAEQWVARYNGPGNSRDAAYALSVDAVGNVYVTGRSYSASTGHDYATIKYNSAGVEQWVVRYNGPGNSDDGATAIAVDPAGNVYVTGSSVGSGTSSDYATIKYNSAGEEQWVVPYNGPGNSDDGATALAIDPAGNVYVTGYSVGSGTYSDYATIKYDGAGAPQWVARYHGPETVDYATALAVDPAGNVYVTGDSYGSSTDDYPDYATIKYDAAGTEQWIAPYSGPGNYFDNANAIAVDPAGNIYVTGGSYAATYDYTTIKYNGAGTEQWVARYNGPGNFDDYAAALAIDLAGNVYVTGGCYGSAARNLDYATIKYDGAGEEQWVAPYNGPGNSNDRATALALDSAGNVYVTGSSVGSGTSDDYATIKYDGAGEEQWIARANGPGYPDDQARALALDHSGNVYVTGSSGEANASRAIYTTIKYNQGPLIVSVKTIPGDVPAAFELGPNYPNPFNPETTIQYAIPAQAGGGVPVTLRIYNLQGQLVHTLVDEQQPPGRYRVVWDERNSTSTKVSSSIYLYTLTAGHFKASKKMAILK